MYCITRNTVKHPTVLKMINSTQNNPILMTMSNTKHPSNHSRSTHTKTTWSHFFEKSTTNESYLYWGNGYDNIQKQCCKFIMKIDIHLRNGNEHYIFLLLHLSVYSPLSSVPSRFFDAVFFFVVCRGDE
jgi:hypothetical protein